MQLNVQRNGSGHPLLILHGLFGSLSNWGSFAKAFARRYTVLAADLRNHGSSPHADVMSYPIMADDLRELFETEAIDSAFVLGHSMGGKTAMQFALRYPELVDRLVVADIAPKAYPPHHDEIFDALASLDVSAYNSRSDLDAALAERLSDRAVRQFLLTNVGRTEDNSFCWKIDIDAIRANYDAIIADIDGDTPFGKPTMFLRGERSDYIGPDDEQQIRTLFPAAEIVTIAGAGHWLHAEAPTEFGRVVNAFLSAQA